MDNILGFMRVMQSVDAFFPIGAFTLSNGLENYVLEDWIRSSEDLEKYILGFLHSFPYQDLGLVHLAYENAENKAYITLLDETAAAMKIPQEVRNGSRRIGKRLIKALDKIGDEKMLNVWYDNGFHPIALGIYGKHCKIEEEQLLIMYGYGAMSSIVNNAVKLVPLGQVDGQKVLYDSFEKLENAVKKAQSITIDDLGISAPANEIHCMRHERLYTRQYMS